MAKHRSKSVAAVKKRLDDSAALSALPSVPMPGFEERRALSHHLVSEIKALKHSIEALELNYQEQIETILEQCQKPGLSSVAQEVADTVTRSTRQLKSHSETELQESKSAYERAIRKYATAKEVSRERSSAGEDELQVEVRDLYRPFMGTGKRGATFYSTGTTSLFVTIPDEKLPLLEQVDIFEEELNKLIADYQARYRDLIMDHHAASQMVRIAQSAKVDKSINLLKVAGDALDKQQSVFAARSRVKKIAQKLEDAGYTIEKADHYKAAKENLVVLKTLKAKLLALHQSSYINPKILTEVKEKAATYSAALKGVEESSREIFNNLRDEIAKYVAFDRGEIGKKFTMAEFLAASPTTASDDESVTITPVSAGREAALFTPIDDETGDDEDERAPSAASSSPRSPFEDPALVFRKDLEQSKRTTLMQDPLKDAITAAVRSYCEENPHINPKVFGRGKPEIDFAAFLKKYLPYPEYGPSYREKFRNAVQTKYDSMRTGHLIALMNPVAAPQLEAGTGEEPYVATHKKPRGRSASPVARNRRKGL
jgi:hypothetical protein